MSFYLDTMPTQYSTKLNSKARYYTQTQTDLEVHARAVHGFDEVEHS